MPGNDVAIPRTEAHDVDGARTADVARFTALADAFSVLARREGVRVIPYGEPGPTNFAALDPDARARALSHFAPYVEVCEELVAKGESLKDDRTLAWAMIKRLGLRPLSSMFAEIAGEDIVEIYAPDHVQIFRNIRFFAVCSYSLDDILSRPFWQLFRREEAVTRALVALGDDVLSQRKKGIQRSFTGMHSIEESDSADLLRSIVENRALAPLFDDGGRVAAALSVVRPASCVSMRDGRERLGPFDFGPRGLRGAS